MPLFNPSIASIFAGTTAATGEQVVFGNANGVSFGAVGNTITASVAPGPAAGIGGVSAGTQLATSGTISFANANGVTFGMAGHSVITASVSVTAAAQAVTLFSQGNFDTNYLVVSPILSIQHVSLPMPISASQGLVLLDIKGNSGSSGGVSFSVGAYTIGGQTASQVVSTVGVITWQAGSFTTASSQYGGVSGVRYRAFSWATSLAPGDYLFVFAISSTNDGTARIFGRYGVNIAGTYAGAETAYFLDGISNTTVGALPASIVATEAGYVRTGVGALQQPGFILIGTT